MTEVLGERLLTRVSFRDLGFSRLFSDYCDNLPEATSLFGGHFLDDATIGRARSTALTTAIPDRQLLADVLAEQNQQWGGSPATRENIELLRQEGTSCVVTGQQLGLFVSPLYTIYKSLTAIKLASQWSKIGKPVVPVFWLADEDHDLAEIATTYVPSPNGELASITYPQESAENLGPTGQLLLDDSVLEAIDSLGDHLPNGKDSEQILAALKDCYKPGRSYADAFASFLHIALPESGLTIISGNDRRLKQLAKPLFARAIVEADELHARLERASEEIAETYHAQLHLRNTNLFWIADGRRVGIDRSPEGYTISGVDGVMSPDELITWLEETPESFSPNVVLRPLYQDTILPTVAYVGGPGEIAYLAQIRTAYEWAGREMPIAYPRMSLSLVDGSSRRLLDAEDISFADLKKRPDELFGQIVSQSMAGGVDLAVHSAKNQIDLAIDSLSEPLASVEHTLTTSLEALRATLHKRLAKLEKKILREEKRKHKVTGDRVARSTSFLFPLGKPQERVILPAYFLARYGSDYFLRLLEDVDVDTTQHVVMRA